MVLILLFGFFGLIFLTAIWARIAPSSPANWHVDPEVVEKKLRQKRYFMHDGQDVDSLIFDLDPLDLAEKVDSIARSQPKVTVLEGSAKSGNVTYVQRTKLIAYPDYISIKISPEIAGKSRLTIYSRSRFGYFDYGVNKARVKAWTAAIGPTTES